LDADDYGEGQDMIVDIPDALAKEIREYAAKDSRWDDEDFDIDGYSGGQTDDAFEMGVEEGHVQLSYQIAACFPPE
jgi:hypothetical protein